MAPSSLTTQALTQAETDLPVLLLQHSQGCNENANAVVQDDPNGFAARAF